MSSSATSKENVITIPSTSQTCSSPDAIIISQINAVQLVLISLGLPPEIATNILEFAEYWCKQSYNHKAPVKMCAELTGNWNECSCLYLQNEPLGFGTGLDDLPRMNPRKVVFTILSPDNGDYLNRENRGYHNNRSWFDISIFREDESWVGNRRRDPMKTILKVSPTWYFAEGRILGKRTKRLRETLGDNYALLYMGNDFSTLPQWLCRDQPDKLVGWFKLVKNKDRLIWVLQQNLLGSSTLLEHMVTWTVVN
jgi:hypothetical protein